MQARAPGGDVQSQSMLQVFLNTFHFGMDCGELPRRVRAYLAFTGQAEDSAAYSRLVGRVVPIGFKDCDPALRQAGKTP